MTAAPQTDRHLGVARPLVILSAGLFLFFLAWTAWIADDAYITFRTIENWFNGFGPRWNVVERVQTFTHPLWMLVLAAAFGVTREIYYTALVVAMSVSLLSVGLFATRIAPTRFAAVFGLTCFTLSTSFVDFSTSGLENPLTHLLLVAFLIVFWGEPTRPRRVLTLSALTACMMMTRPDATLLLLPALGIAAWRAGWRQSLPALAVGFLPIVAWEFSSLTYYGFPFPNSYYAKLSPGITQAARTSQGYVYLVDAATRDPLTLLTIVVSLALTCTRPGWRDWPIAAGMMIYLVAVVRIGGDFMAGRFLTAPLFCAVALLSRLPLVRDYRLAVPSLALVVLIGFPSAYRVLSAGSTFGESLDDVTTSSGISDERRLYYQATGLRLAMNGRRIPSHPWAANGREHRAKGTKVIVKATMGFRGFTAGPGVHVVDVLGVTDPLLARLPPSSTEFHPGHIERAVPDGYVESLETGRNVIKDAGVAAYYEKLRVITQGPLWTSLRLRVIVNMNLGRYDYMLAALSK